MPQETRREMSASYFAFAYSKSGTAQVFLYYVCDATTYSPLFDGQISQIIRFFLTQIEEEFRSQNSGVRINTSTGSVQVSGGFRPATD